MPGKRKYFTEQELKEARQGAVARFSKKCRSNGICVSCGKEPLSKNSKNLCDTCQQKRTARQKRDRARLTQAGKCINCYVNNAVDSIKYCKACQNRQKIRRIRRHNYLKSLVFNHYGGYKCTCCGITDPLFLCIDHMNNDGNTHRRQYKLNNSTALYRWIVINHFPEGFQVLCYNCNMAKRLNNGICIHQMENTDGE